MDVRGPRQISKLGVASEYKRSEEASAITVSEKRQRRTDAWSRSTNEPRGARVVATVATLVVMAVIIAVTVWFFFFAGTSPTASSFL